MRLDSYMCAIARLARSGCHTLDRVISCRELLHGSSRRLALRRSIHSSDPSLCELFTIDVLVTLTAIGITGLIWRAFELGRRLA